MSAAILGRVRLWGNNSLCITIDPELKRQMGLIPKDVLAFRVMTWQNKLILIGEKVPLHALANLKEVPVEMLPKTERKSGS
jgi:hypothetical protein